ncbi:MAG TPA: S8 family serine peptidase [Mycobacteriales bacterium]|nr:S8 family serine peptidase [Mycobacteriales bacterium]
MRPFRPLALAVGVVTSLGLALPAAAAPPPAAATGGLSARTVAQIDALARAKRALTPTQKKVDSRLLTEARQRRGLTAAAGVGRVATGVVTDRAGLTAVTVLGDTKAAAAQVRAVGGQVRDVSARHAAVRADVPLSKVETLAGAAGVQRVEVADQAITARAGGRVAPVAKERREAVLRRRVAAALAGARAAGRPTRQTATGPVPLVGAVTSEGDVTHAADTARSRFRVTGTGVKIGVLSDGVDSLPASIASGDLPPDVEVLPGQAGSGDEGTAMLEIVHDLAPNAKLAFATAFISAESFADNIRALRAAGADIIVDDILYFAESPFQDGPIAQAVIDVTDDGALYFSSAGNEQNVDDRTAGNWEGDYVSSGRTIGKFAGVAHDFAPGDEVQVLDPTSDDSAGVPTILQWADPLGGSDNDYDLYAVAADGSVTAFSNDVQDGDDQAFEGFYLPGGPLGVAVVKFRGEDRYLQVTPFRGRFADRDGLVGYNTPGVTRGHSAVPAAFSVAAVPAAEPFPREIAPGVPNPSGPFPGVYTRAQQSETFTSDGPRRVFFRPDGTPITPGNFTATGGELRKKPDIAAADGVLTTVPGFERFYGTSASAPHAAAIAGLILSGNPGIDPAEVRTALTSTAIDIEQRGWDRDTGHGIVMADRALRYTGATPQPLAVPGAPTVTSTTDGDTFVEPGETAQLSVPVTNRGDGVATGVSVQVTTTAAGVTVRPASRSYGRIAVGETKTGAFAITVPAGWPVGTPIPLRVRVTFAGALSPRTVTFPVPVGEPGPVADFAYAGPAVPIPDANDEGVSIPLAVSGVGPISGVTFSVDGSACSTDVGSTTVGIDHTYTGDLVGTLTAPDGTEVLLFGGIDGSGDNVCQAVFDDGAARSIGQATSVDAPYTGSWRPAGSLSGLVSHPADGTWTFTVADVAMLDTGSVRAFSLHVAGFVGATP